MRKKIGLCILLFLMMTVNSFAQNDSLKMKVLNHLFKIGEIDKKFDIKENRQRDLDGVYIYNLVEPNDYNLESVYVFKVGGYISHSPTFIMLNDKKDYPILNLYDLDKTLIRMIDFLKYKKCSSAIILAHVEAILWLYQVNESSEHWSSK